MDERAIKRLLVIVSASLIAIFLFKMVMSKTIVNLNQAAAQKKQAVVRPANPSQEAIPDTYAPATSAVGEITMQEPTAASGVSEAQ